MNDVIRAIEQHLKLTIGDQLKIYAKDNYIVGYFVLSYIGNPIRSELWFTIEFSLDTVEIRSREQVTEWNDGVQTGFISDKKLGTDQLSLSDPQLIILIFASLQFQFSKSDDRRWLRLVSNL
jgi:hypothetical protein